MRTFPGILASVFLVLLLSGCSGNRDPLKVGAEQSPEDQVIAELLAQLAEAADIPVERRIGLGSNRVTFEALKKGEIDLSLVYSSDPQIGLFNLVRSDDPLGAVRDGSARLALVSAPAFFAPGSIDPATGRPPWRPSPSSGRAS